MESNIIELGTRKLQYNNGALHSNIPNVAVRILNLKAGDTVRWTLAEGMLQLQLEE